MQTAVILTQIAQTNGRTSVLLTRPPPCPFDALITLI